MEDLKPIRSALISVFTKDNLDLVVEMLGRYNVKIYSTGGTLDFIKKQGVGATAVEDLTGFPSILGGRVKTLHPNVFGGILARRGNPDDFAQLGEYQIPEIDLVVVDLYPFEQTVAAGASEAEIIEKIDIGGVSLIRAAAKNYNDVLIVSDREQYTKLVDMLQTNGCATTKEQRRQFAAEAFVNTSHYDTAICAYFNSQFPAPAFAQNVKGAMHLRYGENPHQKASFYGNFNQMFEQLHGKEISYNNLLDIDAAVGLIAEFSDPTIAILKHNNACGVAVRANITQAWTDALAADPVSAFGGVIIANRPIDTTTASEIGKIFFEVLVAPDYDDAALEILEGKKNRIILKQNGSSARAHSFRTVLNGVLMQETDLHTSTSKELKVVTTLAPTPQQVDDLLFANIIVKHSKSNAIVLAKNRQMLASGIGQTSRVDAVRQAVEKARSFNFDLSGASMASDAFFPFADGVEVATKAGITAVIQPGGSVRDAETVDFCNSSGVAMVYTGVRHFRH